MAASDALFFQIAAGLIPVLVLGLAVTDRFDPTTWEPKLRRRWGPLVVIGVGYVLVAELFAIELSFSGSRPSYKVAIVVYAVALSALFAGAVVALPFVQTMGWLGKRLTSVAGIAVLVFGSILLIDAVSDVREADARAEGSCLSVAVERTAQARDERFERSFERVASYEARRSELDRELRQLVAQPPSGRRRTRFLVRQIIDEQSRLDDRVFGEVKALTRTREDRPLLQELLSRDDIGWDELVAAAGC